MNLIDQCCYFLKVKYKISEKKCLKCALEAATWESDKQKFCFKLEVTAIVGILEVPWNFHCIQANFLGF